MDTTKQEKINFLVLGFFVLILMVVFFIMMKNTNNKPKISEVEIREEVEEFEEDTTKYGDGVGFIHELSGSVIAIGEDGTYIRVSIEESGIFSVGINKDTLITKGSQPSSLEEIRPFSPITLSAVPLHSSEMYDYLAKSLDIYDERNMTQEERLEVNLERARLLNN